MAGEVNQDGNRSNPGAGGGDAARNGQQNQTAVAQLVEQRIPNPQVAGSSPSRRVSLETPSHYSFGIYKYGQGYWVRMMTAMLAGVLVLSAAAWAWGQIGARADIPTPRWAFDVTAIEGSVAVGDRVAMLPIGEGEPLGQGTVESFTTAGRNARLVVGSLDLGTNSPLDAKQLEVRRDDGTRAFVASVSRADGIRLFKLVYLQTAVAGLIVVLGGAMTYYYVGRKPQTVDFLIATDGEMRKVNWGTRKVILDSTYVVIGATFLIAAVIFAADALFAQIARALHIIGTGG